MEWKETANRWGRALRDSLGRYRLVWVVILAGLVLLLLPAGGEKEETSTPPETAAVFDLEATERRLAEALSRIDGAGEVTVLLTVTQGGDGERRSEPVVLARGSGLQETVTVQERGPGYQGALLVCAGGDDPQVRLRLTQAVSALTGLGADKIAISKGT